ncbi:hypothetical protein BDF22DRAFT_674166 [Syncephalis plumigaleata]|nr:hypothetical protein BDF22DRAFT_674166 [Syncephalis plumigaleata]
MTTITMRFILPSTITTRLLLLSTIIITLISLLHYCTADFWIYHCYIFLLRLLFSLFVCINISDVIDYLCLSTYILTYIHTYDLHYIIVYCLPI